MSNMNDKLDDSDILTAVPPPMAVVRFKRRFVMIAYLFGFVAFVWCAVFDAPAALPLLALCCVLLAMHFELSYRIDVMCHVLKAFVEDAAKKSRGGE